VSIAVDLVTGPTPPSYTLELLRRLPPEVDHQILSSASYGASAIGIAYRLVNHPVRVWRSRRQGAILHVDSQLLSYVLTPWIAPPRVLTVYDLVPFQRDFDDPSYVSRKSFWNSFFFKRLAHGLWEADRIIAVSDYTRGELVRVGIDASRISIIPMGVDTQRFHPSTAEECARIRAKYGIPPSRPIVLYVGTEHPRKNLDALLRAFAQVTSSAVLVKVSVPRHPQHEILERLARSLGVASRVRSLEGVVGEDLPGLYGAADVLVLPSLTEGFGLPPLEAMACGTPVAVSNAGSLPDVVGNAGLLFDPRDVASVADAIQEVLSDSALRDELRVRGQSRARQFPWEATVQGVLHVYKAAKLMTGESD